MTHLASRRSDRDRRAHARAFTLVELMVSLTAGAIIAMAVVALARTATNSFYEQIRMSSVEASVRVASERLRSDLLRAGYMSTSNIKFDPRIATYPGSPNSRYTSTTDLQSLFITVGGSTAAAQNGLTPDRIRIAGNMTSDDAYRGRLTGGPGACGGGEIIFESISDPATARLVNAADPTRAVKNVFAPKDNVPFIVRVVDKHRCQHFVETCTSPITNAASTGYTLNLKADSGPSGGNGVLLASSISPANCGVAAGESDLIVSPVHRVDWWVGQDSELPTATQTVVAQQTLQQGGVQTEDAAFKFNLYRQLYDAADNPVFAAPEIVAEYAIDMKFGLVVHDLSAAAPDNYKTFDMDTGGTNITAWTKAVSSITTSNGPGPQRIRSVRYRLATRSAIPDRTADLSVSAPKYLSRYCVSAATPCKTFARVRTLISEVALLNQERSFY